MSVFSALVFVLKDEYTEEELELNTYLVNNCMELVLIDERCDRSRALVPMEIAYKRFCEKYCEKKPSKTQMAPGKIELEIEDDVRQTDRRDAEVYKGPSD